MACLRSILLSFCDISNEEARVTINIRDTLISRKSFIAGYLIFGNLADNAYDPKTLLVVCLTATASYYILSSIVLFSTSLSEESKLYVMRIASDCPAFFQSGINIIATIQVFNWFPKAYLGTVLTLWLLSDPFGFALQFLIGGYW